MLDITIKKPGAQVSWQRQDSRERSHQRWQEQRYFLGQLRVEVLRRSPDRIFEIKKGQLLRRMALHQLHLLSSALCRTRAQRTLLCRGHGTIRVISALQWEQIAGLWIIGAKDGS